MTRLASLLALAGLAACTAETPSSPTPTQAFVPAPDRGALVDLSASLDAVKTNFNAHRGEARFLTLLSPS